MVHGIFHEMYKSKESGFCWGIDVSTETHGKVFKIVVSLNSDVHGATNPVIEVSSM